MQTSVRGRGGFVAAVGALLAVWLAALTPSPARAGDVTTLSGVTYRDARPVRVEPDGVTWEHAAGIAKVDFTDLLDAVRQTYHYDERKAAEYQSAQTQARQQADERARQTRREADLRRAQLFQQQQQAADSSNAAPTDGAADAFIFRRHALDLRIERSIGEEIETRKVEHDWLTRGDGTIWDRRLWAVPALIFGNSNVDLSEHPVIDSSRQVFRKSLRHAPGGFAPSSGNDAFFQPDYMTRAYYKDVERAEAFARGRP